MSKKTSIVEILRKHSLNGKSYDSNNWGTYYVFCECGDEFGHESFEGAMELHCKHIYAKLKKALKKAKKKKLAFDAVKVNNGKSITTYYQGANFGD